MKVFVPLRSRVPVCLLKHETCHIFTSTADIDKTLYTFEHIQQQILLAKSDENLTLTGGGGGRIGSILGADSKIESTSSIRTDFHEIKIKEYLLVIITWLMNR